MIGGKDEVRCAIVDSGVQRELSGNNIFGGITFKRSEAGIEIIENEYQDENGHGSMVYRTLAQTDTEFYIVKVLRIHQRIITSYSNLHFLLRDL